MVPDLPLDEVAVAKHIGIFNKLRLPDVAGKPPLRDAAGDWYRLNVLAPVFGSVDASGLRHVRNVLVLVPKKNSKTTNAGGTMVTAVLGDKEPLQRYSLLGPTQSIADRGYAQAAGMIRADEVLSARFHIADHRKLITDRVTESTLRVQTFDESVATGEIPKGVLVDEVHILGKVNYAARVLGQLEGGMLARPGAFILKITTQSDQPPAGVFKAELRLARDIRDGRVTGAAAGLLPVLYEFDEAFQRSGAWRDPKIWHWVLPNLGRSLRLDMLEDDFAKAQAKGEEEVRRWASQHLNVEIGLGLHAQRWRGADWWEAAGAPELCGDLDEMLARCEVAVAGVDGGGLDDLFGLCVAGRERDTRRWLLWFKAWVHRSVLELRKEIAPALTDFAADGDLIICDDPMQDVREVAALLGRVAAKGLFPEKSAIGLDPQGVGILVDALAELGLTFPQVVAVGQGYRLSSAVWSMEKFLAAGNLKHSGSRMMAWCVGNAKAEQRGNAVLITKEAAGKAKIDPLVAGFNAAKGLELNPEAAGDGRSVYETRGLVRV